MDLRKLFIHNLKVYRTIRGISQMRLAELCGSSTGYIGQIEIGKKFPSIDMIDKMSEALNIKPYMLFLDESEPDNPPPSLAGSPNLLPESLKDDLIIQLTAAMRRVIKQILPQPPDSVHPPP